ncbi:major capsid protein [Streptomyces drozdowiczii]|uniref:Major capsid protein n=1 Tax=Streptomyces drozdowiczii TaxID=202862 RepID=A0ABY6PQK1_9ACTN|nr:major capsid protein [Streptomyces drozdowiczii]MCX0246415.1 major capsid protein [Streptomyces drozdowiczii]UZK54081.1 major capsid protein [Streptomyces drozdowiczii]
MADDPNTQTPEPEAPAAFDPATATDDALYAEYSRVRTEGQELAAQADADPARLTELAAAIPALRAEIDARQARAAEVSAARDAFSALPELAAPAPVAPAAPEPAADPAPEPVAPVPSVSEMSAQTRPVPARTEPERRGDRITVALSSDAAGALRRDPGDSTTVREIGEASTRLFSQFGTSRSGGGIRASRALATFQRDRGTELTLTGDREHDATVVAHARSQSRLSGGGLMQAWQESVKAGGDGMGALTAAAGWCAPSENRYELCSLWTSDGMLDLPTTTAPRGGINYSRDWSWAQIMDASLTSFTRLTEAEVIAGETKDCTTLPCPTFEDRRLDVAVTCITGSFLQDVGYRENVATLIDGLTLKHERMVNQDVISQILTEAGTAIVIPAQGATAPGSGPDSSAVSSILAALDVAAIDMRYREQMSETQVLEAVLPQWVLAQWRADIGRRNAWHTDPFALANATIMSWFSVRNIRPQFIRGWQDAQSGLSGGPGDITAPITPITALPTTVDFLLYPAGAIVLARQDVITLTNVYDSTNLSQNLYTALFMEEGYAPIFPCGEVRRYTANACPSGATGAQVWTSCAAPAEAA